MSNRQVCTLRLDPDSRKQVDQLAGSMPGGWHRNTLLSQMVYFYLRIHGWTQDQHSGNWVAPRSFQGLDPIIAREHLIAAGLAR